MLHFVQPVKTNTTINGTWPHYTTSQATTHVPAQRAKTALLTSIQLSAGPAGVKLDIKHQT